jgi:hypothetical protein
MTENSRKMDVDEQKPSPPPLRRAAVLLLTMLLACVAIYVWQAKVGDQRVLFLLSTGIVLGVIYTIRGGSLPQWLHRLGGGKITKDDDPRNLSPKVYLPVLLAVIVVAALLYLHYTGGSHRR